MLNRMHYCKMMISVMIIKIILVPSEIILNKKNVD